VVAYISDGKEQFKKSKKKADDEEEGEASPNSS
jgi:hypothetical protein